jgi:hypothetical protein
VKTRGIWHQHHHGVIEDSRVPKYGVTIVGSLAVVHDDRHRIAAVAVITEAYAARAISRAGDTSA